MANARTRTVPVEGAFAAFHPEVKLGPFTSVLRFSCHYVHAIHACKDVFNPNVTKYMYISVKLL